MTSLVTVVSVLWRPRDTPTSTVDGASTVPRSRGLFLQSARMRQSEIGPVGEVDTAGGQASRSDLLLGGAK